MPGRCEPPTTNLDHDPAHHAPARAVVVSRGEPRDPAIELAPPGLAWQRMVRWYDPRIIFHSAKEILFRKMLGPATLPCSIEPGDDCPRYFDYRAHCERDQDGGFWIDYVSDIGDGWDSTYTVARGIGGANLAVGGPPGCRDVTVLPRASILVLGGDEVYPVGSRRSYDERLVAPYAAAVRDLADGDPHPDVFAIPGNHDWYDNLVAFSPMFLSNQWFTHWRTMQNRSYFAVRLPGHWWLLGTDIELGCDIDREQLAYFEYVASCMDDDDRVILCNAMPHWISEALAGDRERPSSNLKDLEGKVLKDRTWLYLAGDLHHYRRHTCRSDGRLKITAGGGGAFAHPTHTNLAQLATITDEVVDERGHAQTRVYELETRSCFPPLERSRRIIRLNLLPFGIVWHQPLFFLMPAVLYLLTWWMVALDLESLGAILWTAGSIAGFITITPVERLSHRIAVGLAHSFVHLGGALLCAWLAARLALEIDPRGSAPELVQGLLVFALGGVIGSMIFGWYLTIMCEVFGVLQNEAASTQGCSHWKSFLRLRIGPDGDLTIHPIGIAKTPRWSSRGYRPGPGAAAAVPRDGREEHEIYRYIEPPVVIPARAPSPSPSLPRS
jgi:hypothetical protein